MLADRHGTAIHLGERDCSIQRRHQKVLEESPSPALDESLRAAMGEAAVAFARAVGYENAGTAEFMLDGERFYFLELNARLQVEHPVTELVTGLDLVEQQLLVAAGEPLSIEPREPEGHAVEVRLYAEHPLTFLPQAGRLERLELPDTVRVDAGVEAGDEIPVAYDPLIAKLIAHGETREEAFDDLSRALRATRVSGRDDQPRLPPLARRPSRRARRACDDRVPGGASSALASDRAARPLVGRLAAQPRPRARRRPPSAPPPTVEQSSHASDSGGEQSAITAPMPGVVIRVLAAEGDRVEPRQPLVVLEAMKMETPLVSPYEGVVRRVHVAEGDRVAGGTLLVELEE